LFTAVLDLCTLNAIATETNTILPAIEVSGPETIW
jgi:hypothetical protein